jgi:hypothetical protein
MSRSFVYNMNMWHPKWLHSHCERKLREALGLDRMFKNHTGKIQTAYNRKERTHKMLQRYAGDTRTMSQLQGACDSVRALGTTKQKSCSAKRAVSRPLLHLLRNRSPFARIADPPIPSSFTTSPWLPNDPICLRYVGRSS